MGKSAEAENAFREALRIRTRLVQDYPQVLAYRNDLAVTMVSKATLHLQNKQVDSARQLLEEALPYHQAALQADPGNLEYRKAFRDNRQWLGVVLLELGKHAEAAKTAGELIQAAVDPANDLYNAACIFARCVPLAERDRRLSESQRKERSQAYTDRALAMLRQAIQHGNHDLATMRKDTDLDPLRPHPEFQKLLQELEAKSRTERK